VKDRSGIALVRAGMAGSGASIGLLLGGALTQSLSWRFCMYVNVVFALVFGFAHAQTTGWSNHLTIWMLSPCVLLLTLFGVLEARVTDPLLPLRVVAERNRGASFLSIGISGGAIFAVILFLTYYLQQTRGFSPVGAGLAFLPMTAAIMSSAVIGLTKLHTRFGPRSLGVSGMALGALGMLYLTRLDLNSSYAAVILPALVVIGIGLGLVISTSISNATLGPRSSAGGRPPAARATPSSGSSDRGRGPAGAGGPPRSERAR
jgi:MFS family permease